MPYFTNHGQLRRKPLCPVLMLAALACGCFQKIPEPDLDSAAFRERTHRICLFHARSEIQVEDLEKRLAAIEELFVVKLQSRGFEVVWPAEVEETFERIAEEENDLYDPHTGIARPGEVDQVRQRMLGELGCDVTASPNVVIVRAPFNNGTAEWDGTERPMGGGWGDTGWVSALSLWIRMHDREGEEVYFHTGGIQILGQLDRGFLRQKFAPVSERSILIDSGSNRAAVRQSLDLLGAREPRRP